MTWFWFLFCVLWNFLALVGALYVIGVVVRAVREWLRWRRMLGKDL